MITGLDLPTEVLQSLERVLDVWKCGFVEDLPAMIASVNLAGSIIATMQEGAHLTLAQGAIAIELDRPASQELFDLLMRPAVQDTLGW